jgi:hypothetical protein
MTTDDDLIEREQGDRCGQCGEPVPEGATVCPACGALLAAYRAAPESPESPEFFDSDDSVLLKVIEEIEPEKLVTAPDEPVFDDDLADDLYHSRDEFETLIQDAFEELDERADSESPPEPHPAQARALPIVEPAVSPPTVRSRPATQSRPIERKPNRPTHPARPHKPGYVARGTVEPVLLLGFTLLVLAGCLVALASLLSVDGAAIAGFTLGAVGIIAIVVAVLIALIRREGGQR